MKTGPVILVLFGILLLAFLYMSPVSPSIEPGTGDNEEALPETETSSGNTPETMVDEALQKMQSGELPPMQAVLQIRDVADKYPGNVKANYTLGVLSMQTGQYEKAAERFETVLEKQPENVDALRLLAEARLNLGDTVRARQLFDKAGELVNKPDS